MQGSEFCYYIGLAVVLFLVVSVCNYVCDSVTFKGCLITFYCASAHLHTILI